MAYMLDTEVPERIEAVEILRYYPYFILKNEENTTKYREDLLRIKEDYIMYKKGVRFYPEGSGGDYVPSTIRYKDIKRLIDKEARFMFSQTPDINIVELSEGDKDMIEQYEKFVNKVLEKNKFQKKILQSAKDCFVGKRVACLIDFEETTGVMLHFYTALQFYYHYMPGTEILDKFICYEKIYVDLNKVNYMIYIYTLENNSVYVEGALYDSMGNVLEELVKKMRVELEEIPVVIIFNDGMLEDTDGVSEVEELEDYERGYNLLSNCDIDSVRKGMNPVTYVVDMNSRTTKNLSSGAGSFWELKSEQNQNEVHPMVGVLAPALNHTEALKATLDRLKIAMHEALDVPNINEESLSGTITSGKALKALYYPLTVRCDEKLKTWKPAIKDIVEKVLRIAFLYKQKIKQLYGLSDFEEIQFEVDVQENYALLEDVQEEMKIDLDEIAQNARSRKSYVKKWRKDEIMDDEKAQSELMQIAVEQNMFDTTSINMNIQDEIDRNSVDDRIEENIEEEKDLETIDNKLKVGDEDENEE